MITFCPDIVVNRQENMEMVDRQIGVYKPIALILGPERVVTRFPMDLAPLQCSMAAGDSTFGVPISTQYSSGGHFQEIHRVSSNRQRTDMKILSCTQELMVFRKPGQEEDSHRFFTAGLEAPL